MLQNPGSQAVIREHPIGALLLLGISAAAWLFIAWLATDMDTPLALLVMPMSPDWSASTVLAVWSMWSVMMVAMMLPSALPMILTFVQVAQRNRQPARAHAFVAAYVLVWIGFAAAGTAGQWALQQYGALDAMALRSSAAATVVLLLVAGLYQFSPLKRVCLASCRTPLAFLRVSHGAAAWPAVPWLLLGADGAAFRRRRDERALGSGTRCRGGHRKARALRGPHWRRAGGGIDRGRLGPVGPHRNLGGLVFLAGDQVGVGEPFRVIQHRDDFGFHAEDGDLIRAR
jgi:hypothetical protein